MNLNLSILDDDRTARTDPDCAFQRAATLGCLGVKSVLELCVGPSLRVLEEMYARYNIVAAGNDIELRWKRYYPEGRWIIGDALTVDWSPFDAVVFAPPVTRGCTGRRDDSLRISEVLPRYTDFLSRPFPGVKVMVLPARATATSEDRREMHELLASAYDATHEVAVIPLKSGRREIRKYVDVYIYNAATPREAAPIGDIDSP
jgi:hypothetical protein